MSERLALYEEAKKIYDNEPFMFYAAYKVHRLFNLDDPIEIICAVLKEEQFLLRDNIHWSLSIELMTLCIVCDKWNLFYAGVEKHKFRIFRKLKYIMRFALYQCYKRNRSQWLMNLFTEYNIFDGQYAHILSIKQLEFIQEQMRTIDFSQGIYGQHFTFPLKFLRLFRRQLDEYLSMLENYMPNMPSDIIGIIGDFHCYQDLQMSKKRWITRLKIKQISTVR